jgi:hypothetical protein
MQDGIFKGYKPKEQNVKKLKLFLNKIENGRKENKRINSERNNTRNN